MNIKTALLHCSFHVCLLHQRTYQRFELSSHGSSHDFQYLQRVDQVLGCNVAPLQLQLPV